MLVLSYRSIAVELSERVGICIFSEDLKTLSLNDGRGTLNRTMVI